MAIHEAHNYITSNTAVVVTVCNISLSARKPLENLLPRIEVPLPPEAAVAVYGQGK